MTMTSMPMNVCGNPEPGMVTNGQLKPVAMAFASIVLPVPGGPEEEQPALALAAGLLELVAGLPEIDDARDLALGLGLAAHVLQPYAPVGVARLVALDLAEAINSIGPNRISRFMKKKQRQDQELAAEHRRSPGSMASHSLASSPNQVYEWPNAARRSTARCGGRGRPRRCGIAPSQYHERRRDMTSSARMLCSAPNRLGHGMSRRAPTSTRPRKAATPRIVSRIGATAEARPVQGQEDRRAGRGSRRRWPRDSGGATARRASRRPRPAGDGAVRVSRLRRATVLLFRPSLRQV